MVERRKMALAFRLLVRAAFVALSVLTSIYCVLAYIPDTYIAFIQAPFQPWLPAMIRFQPLLFTTTLAALGISLWRESSGSAARRLAVEFLGFHAAAAAYFWMARPLPRLETHAISFVWAVALLFPVLWLGVVDWKLYWQRAGWSEELRAAFRPLTALIVGLAIGISYPAAIYVRYALAGRLSAISKAELHVWGATLLAHVLFFLIAFGIGMLSESIAVRFRMPAKFRFVALTAGVFVALAVFFARSILPFIPFLGIEPLVYSIAIAGALALAGSGLVLVVRAGAGKTAQVVEPRRAEALLWAAVLFMAAVEVPAMLGIFDWNSIQEKFWVLLFWSAVTLVVMRFTRRDAKPATLAVAAGVPIASYLAYAAVFSLNLWTAPDSPWHAAIEQHKSQDISYVVASGFLTVQREMPCDDLCRFLRQESNIAQSVDPPELRLVDGMQPAKGPLPNVFIIVVDSLRQDVVAPYAPSVDNTPEMARFAADSVVFRNAFTRYAGTTLSEPAIWAGAMLLHKHYTQPFARVNNLERLLVTDRYQSYVSVDTTLRMLLDRTPGMVALDSHVTQWTELDLCRTTDELGARLAARDGRRPVFFYTQPQNMHVISVKRHRLNALDLPGERVKQAYLEEMRHVDGCFGRFVRLLKQKGLYDNSVIVLTADHGEFGHDAHTYSLETAIMKVPLIMHVPPAVRKSYYFDPERVAFTTDITPSVYYLAGHHKIRNDELFGRPLFTVTREEAAAYERNSYLLASTYEPVYGILRDNGRTLFFVDEVKGKTFLYDLVADPGSDHNQAGAASVGDSRELIRAHVAHIAEEYHFRYQPTTLMDWLQR